MTLGRVAGRRGLLQLGWLGMPDALTVVDGTMRGDLVGAADEVREDEALLVPAMRSGRLILREPFEAIRRRSAASLTQLPAELRLPPAGATPAAYPVTYSNRLLELAATGTGGRRFLALGHQSLQPMAFCHDVDR